MTCVRWTALDIPRPGGPSFVAVAHLFGPHRSPLAAVRAAATGLVLKALILRHRIHFDPARK